jgi:hypothetical protein
MKKLSLNKVENLSGGTPPRASSVIEGVCLAAGTAVAVGMWTPGAPAAWTMFIGCGINSIANNQGWW